MASSLRLACIAVIYVNLTGCTNSKIDTLNDDTVPVDSAEIDTGDHSEDIEYGECGDGVVNNPNEECDDGNNNSNSPDACRTDCLLPKCGDGIQDSEEECDDGNLFNIDGCSAVCSIENGEFEIEPNDVPTLALPVNSSGTIQGSLWEFDKDCYRFTFEHNDHLSLHINPSQEECSHLMLIEIYEDGEVVDTDIPVNGECASLDPQIDHYARHLPDSDTTDTTICVSGLLGAAVEQYEISWDTSSDSCTLEDLELTEEEDPDSDMLANNCDEDDDNDGIIDALDNCPLISNNGIVEFAPTDSGFLRTWILTSAFQVSGLSTSACQPLPNLLMVDETDVYPSLESALLDYNEDPVEWSLYTSSTDKIDFNTISALGNVAAPREVFAGLWVYSDSLRSVDAKFGPDDGGKVWINGTLIGETDLCQGATSDKYTFPTQLNSGWNRILIQIRDGGGGWAFYFRFTENGIPVTDLLLSPVSTGLFEDYQSDLDNDGIGDQCDLID